MPPGRLPVSLNRPLLAAIAGAAGLVWLASFSAPCLAIAQAQMQTQVAPGAGSASSPARPSVARGPASGVKVAGAPPKPAAKVVTRPLWTELTPAQQQALAPLQVKWDTVSEAQKRKWIALSANFPRMSGAEQAKLHSRMTEWVGLSPQQRTQARLNFGEAQQLSPDDKKAKWEAYQALSPEEKKKLAAGVTKPPPTAAAIKPVMPEKLAAVPQPKPKAEAKIPRIAAAPNQVDHHTLLPQPTPPSTLP